MATVNGLTAERMLEIEAETIINGYVSPSLRLILERHDGTELDVGDISAVAKLGVVDTTTLDLTLTGNGSVASPFSVKGDVKPLNASIITNGTLDPARVPNQFVPALLDPTYVGPGPARVKFFFGGTLSTEKYQWIGKYEPWGNRVVTMVRMGSSWAIMGHSSEESLGGKIKLTLQNNWLPYNRANAVPDKRWANPRAQKLSSGIVILSGLVIGGAFANGTVITNLPIGYRPDTDMIFPINNGDTAKTVLITAGGDVITYGTNWVFSYASLDGIAFPAAGIATWTTVGDAGSGTAFANNWIPTNPGGTFGLPRFWKDPYGFVWWAGLITGGTQTEALPMITMPLSLAPDEQTHSKVANTNAFGFISAVKGATPALVWKAGNTATSWISLSGLAIASNDAVINPDNVWINTVFPNSWTRYSTSFPMPAIMRRGDGLGVAKGLLKGGSAPPVKVAATPYETWPENEIILYSISAALFNRVDIRGPHHSLEDDRGAYIVHSGSTSWVSWDNQMWMVGD